MDYQVDHKDAIETHTITLHKVDVLSAVRLIDHKLYAEMAASNSVADKVLALALVCKAVEEYEKLESEPAKPENLIVLGNGNLAKDSAGKPNG